MSIKRSIVKWVDEWVNGSPPSDWTLEEAIEFARMLEPLLADVGWHVALTGSVLYKGHSDNDLDVIVYPSSTETSTKEALYGALERAELKLRFNNEFVTAQWRAKGSLDCKHVEVWGVKAEKWRSKRIDVFVLK